MEETPHLVAHFMAAGAEKRLEDYHFLRNTYETITGQEIQLNRILRMLGEDEISLNWRLDLSPIGRTRSRSLCNFERWANSLVLRGSIAYERFRELEDTSKSTKLLTIPSSSRRVQEMRERRQRLSEQRELSSGPSSSASGASSASRVRALAEYEAELAESDAKRQRQAEEIRLSTLRNEEKETSDRKREKFRTTFTDDDSSYAKSKQQEDRSTKRTSLKEDQGKDVEGIRKSSNRYAPDKSGDIELISFTVRCQPIPSSSDEEGEDNSSIRLLCRWASPSSSSAIDYFTIERQQGDGDWLPIGEQIDKSETQTQLDIPSSNENNNGEGINTNIPAYFRLKAHLQSGQTFTSKPTDGILVNFARMKNIIAPEVEILSPSSVQLTWTDHENEEKENEENRSEEKSNIYDIEKKEEQQPEWEKVTEVPLSQGSATIDNLTDANQCQFRLIPSLFEPEEPEKSNAMDTVGASEDQDTADEFSKLSAKKTAASSEDQAKADESPKSTTKKTAASSKDEATADESPKSATKKTAASSEDEAAADESPRSTTQKTAASPKDEATADESPKSSAKKTAVSSEDEVATDESPRSTTKKTAASSEDEAAADESPKSSTKKATVSPKDEATADESPKSSAKKATVSSEDEATADESPRSTTKKTAAWSEDEAAADESPKSSTKKATASPKDEATADASPKSSAKKATVSSEDEATADESPKSTTNKAAVSSEDEAAADESPKSTTKEATASPKDEATADASQKSSAKKAAVSSEDEATADESPKSTTKKASVSSEDEATVDESPKSSAKKTVTSSEDQVIEDEPRKYSSKNTAAPLDNEVSADESAVSENEVEPEETAEPENEEETEVLMVNNVNELLSSLHVVPTSSNTVDIDISEEGFKDFDCYKIEYTTDDRFGQWKQVSDITHDDPHLTIDKLKQGTDYKFRFTPITSDASTKDETDSSQLSLTLDVRTPSTRRGRFAKDESETPVATPPQFTIQKVDPSTVLIEAVVPEDKPAAFKDVYDVYSKKETEDTDEDDWTKVGTIDKNTLSATVEDLEENTAYAFKIDNITSSSTNDENKTVQEFKFNTTPAKEYDPTLFLEKIEQSLENVVNGVMQAAAGHKVLEEPINQCLNEVIKEVFRDESLVPNEEYGFDTLALNTDLQLYRGPKQMMLKELEVDETIDLSKHYGEIIIHNYRTAQQSVVVREENGNTRVANIDGDIIIRNVVSDVMLKNEQTRHQLSMNIVGQAFLKGVQGTLIASKFKGIIVVKNVNKP